MDENLDEFASSYPKTVKLIQSNLSK